MVYGKPLVYFLISYFMLAGVREINIICPERNMCFINEELKTGGEIGIEIKFIDEIED